MKTWFLEWLASLLVLFGVSFIAMSAADGYELWSVIVGSVLLTFGIRLAIDVAAAKGRS
jgi:hypothetical protein